MEKVDNNYYENLLKRGINLNSCVMIHNAYWSYFMELNSCYPNAIVHTFGRSIYHLASQIRKYPNDYSYEMYDLFLLSSNGGYDEDDLEELEQLAEKISTNKRVTFGYYYPVAQQGCCSYKIESYFMGTKDFNNEGVLERPAIDAIQMINIMAEQHMKLMENNYQKVDGNGNMELRLFKEIKNK